MFHPVNPLTKVPRGFSFDDSRSVLYHKVMITVARTRSKKHTPVSRDLRALFTLIGRVADTAERILEEQEEFSKEFLRGLQRSLKEARSGKLMKIESLSEL